MNLTFLIGNGFDRQCGLLSSYKEVYNAYIEQPNKSRYCEILCNHLCDIKEKENWSDFEIGLYKNANKFSNIEELRSCVEDFKIFIKNYLRNEDNKFLSLIAENENKTKIKHEMEKSIDEYYSYLVPNVSRILRPRNKGMCNFISLNYTKALGSIIDISKYTANGNDIISGYKYGDCILAHGSYDDQIILGADNINQFINEGCSLNKYEEISLVKSRLIENYDNRDIQKAYQILYFTDTLCVFGASLGESDLTWRNRIIEWLKENESRHLVRCYKPGEKEKPEDPGRMIEFEDMYVDAFLNELGLSDEEKELLSSRVHVPLGNRQFSFQDILLNK